MVNEYAGKKYIDFDHVFKPSITKMVKVITEGLDIDYPKEIDINHRENEITELLFHINTQEFPRNFEMIFCCKTAKIERYFKVNFKLCE